MARCARTPTFGARGRRATRTPCTACSCRSRGAAWSCSRCVCAAAEAAGRALMAPDAQVGGIMVYSTCSFNPVENEAVVAELLRLSRGSVQLCDVSARLPALPRRPGLRTWRVATGEPGGELQWHDSCETVPEEARARRRVRGRGHVCLRLLTCPCPAAQPQRRVHRSAFPPPAHEADALGLSRCLRFLPHDSDSGGFFAAVLTKTGPLPASSGRGARSRPGAGRVLTAGAQRACPRTLRQRRRLLAAMRVLAPLLGRGQLATLPPALTPLRALLRRTRLRPPAPAPHPLRAPPGSGRRASVGAGSSSSRAAWRLCKPLARRLASSCGATTAWHPSSPCTCCLGAPTGRACSILPRLRLRCARALLCLCGVLCPVACALTCTPRPPACCRPPPAGSP